MAIKTKLLATAKAQQGTAAQQQDATGRFRYGVDRRAGTDFIAARLEGHDKIAAGKVSVAVPVSGGPGSVFRRRVLVLARGKDEHEVTAVELAVQVGVAKIGLAERIDPDLAIGQRDQIVGVDVVLLGIRAGADLRRQRVDVGGVESTVRVEVTRSSATSEIRPVVELLDIFIAQGRVEDREIIDQATVAAMVVRGTRTDVELGQIANRIDRIRPRVDEGFTILIDRREAFVLRAPNTTWE